MNNITETQDFDVELQKLLSNIENIKADVDLYSMLVEEQVVETV